jgi:hypothetical protein
MAQGRWMDAFRTALDRWMRVTGCDGADDPKKLRCTIDMYGVRFTLEMMFLYEGFDVYSITCFWESGGRSDDSVEMRDANDVIKLVQKIRNLVSASRKSQWLSWQKWLVNELCDKGVVPSITGQFADKKSLKLMLPKDDANFYVEIHFGDSSNVSYVFTSCTSIPPNKELIRRAWSGHHPNVDKIASDLVEDLARAPAIERDINPPIHTGPGSEIVSGAGGGAAACVGGGASAKLRLYEAIVDLFLSFHRRDISEATANTISDLLREVKGNLDTVS